MRTHTRQICQSKCKASYLMDSICDSTMAAHCAAIPICVRVGDFDRAFTHRSHHACAAHHNQTQVTDHIMKLLVTAASSLVLLLPLLQGAQAAPDRWVRYTLAPPGVEPSESPSRPISQSTSECPSFFYENGFVADAGLLSESVCVWCMYVRSCMHASSERACVCRLDAPLHDPHKHHLIPAGVRRQRRLQ